MEGLQEDLSLLFSNVTGAETYEERYLNYNI